jgi:hypothetical protein
MAIKKRAEDWAKNGIDTLEAAVSEISYLETIQKTFVEIKAFVDYDIEKPSPQIAKYLRAWAVNWGFSTEMILYALGESGKSFSEANKLLKKYTNDITTIQIETFASCQGLSKVTIPSSINVIENNAFYNCNNLLEITIPDSVSAIGVNALADCDKLTNVILGHPNEDAAKEVIDTYNSTGYYGTVTSIVTGENAYSYISNPATFTSFPILYEPFKQSIRNVIYDILSGYNLAFDELSSKYIPFSGCDENNTDTHIKWPLVFKGNNYDGNNNYSAIANDSNKPNNITFTYGDTVEVSSINFTANTMLASNSEFSIGIKSNNSDIVNTQALLDEDVFGNEIYKTVNTNAGEVNLTLQSDESTGNTLKWSGNKILYTPTNNNECSFSVANNDSGLKITGGTFDNNTLKGAQLNLIGDDNIAIDDTTFAGAFTLTTANNSSTLTGKTDGVLTWSMPSNTLQISSNPTDQSVSLVAKNNSKSSSSTASMLLHTGDDSSIGSIRICNDKNDVSGTISLIAGSGVSLNCYPNGDLTWHNRGILRKPIYENIIDVDAMIKDGILKTTNTAIINALSKNTIDEVYGSFNDSYYFNWGTDINQNKFILKHDIRNYDELLFIITPDTAAYIWERRVSVPLYVSLMNSSNFTKPYILEGYGTNYAYLYPTSHDNTDKFKHIMIAASGQENCLCYGIFGIKYR